MSTSSTRGHFGHDAYPSVDFLIEVESLKQRITAAALGVRLSGKDKVETLGDVARAIDVAMDYDAGDTPQLRTARRGLVALREQVVSALEGGGEAHGEVEGREQLMRLRTYMARVAARTESADGSATQASELSEQIIGLMEELMEAAPDLKALPAFQNAGAAG